MMPLPSEARGSAAPADKVSVERRRAAAKRVREARDRLTSTTGTRPAFDYELLRQFAQTRYSAWLAVTLQIGAIGFMSALWTGLAMAGVWTAGALTIHATFIATCRKLLSEPPGSINVIAWRLRFIALDLCLGVTWMLNILNIVHNDSVAGAFVLFVMLLVVAVSSMLASSLPIAMVAATIPVTCAVALDF